MRTDDSGTRYFSPRSSPDSIQRYSLPQPTRRRSPRTSKSRRDALIFIADNDVALIGSQIRGDRACPHMSAIGEDTVADVVVVRNLDVTERENF